MKRLESKTLALISIAVAAVLFVAVNILSNVWLVNARLDLTEGRAYSTSEQVAPVFEQIGEPILVRVYYSTAVGEISTRHAIYFQRVRNLLEQYAKVAKGKLKIEYYNPEPFSDVEDRAVGFGLQGIPLGRGADVGYFGLAATNSTDDEQVIPFFNLEREQFLEYDLTKLIYTLSEPSRPKVGLVSSLTINGGAAPQAQPGMPPSGGGARPPWAVVQQIKEFFTVIALDADLTEVPKDIGILMLVQPEKLSDVAQYAIDQFVLRGGKAMVFVDPNAESSSPAGGMAMMQAGGADLGGINKLLAAWGVKVPEKQVIGDIESAMRVSMTAGSRPIVSDYVAWLQLRRGNFDPNDAITGDLRLVSFGTPGAIDKVEGATTTVTPLITTGPQSMRIETDKFVGMPDIVALFREFKPQGKREMLAARITGPAKSAFAAAPSGRGEHLAEAKQPIQVVVVADTDILTDRFWTEANNFLGQQVVIPTADNGTFAINILENLTGSPALSSLRGRGVQARPFVLVDTIRRQAEQQYRAKEQSLTGRLDELQKKVTAMQPKADASGAAILSDQDKKTIESYRSDILATRRELRSVQRALREDIDRLETAVKFINIGAVPVLFGLVLVVAAGVRRRRRQRRLADA